jgi:hypothetical protein
MVNKPENGEFWVMYVVKHSVKTQTVIMLVYQGGVAVMAEPGVQLKALYI